MKKSLIAISSASLLVIGIYFFGVIPSSVVASPEVKVIGNTKSKVVASFLNVRQGPDIKYNIVCVLKKNDTVEVIGKYENWYVIFNPINKCVGFASIDYIKSIEGNVTQYPKPKVTQYPKPRATNKETIKPTWKPTWKPTVKPTAKPISSTKTIKPTATFNNQGQVTNNQEVATKDEIYLLQLINKEREKNNIPNLMFDMGALKTSRLKAKDMVDKNYFSHQSPTYGSPFDMMKQFGVSFKTAGENIAGNMSSENAVKAWMNSEGHRKNILNASFNYNGIGIVDSPVYGKVFVQQFLGK